MRHVSPVLALTIALSSLAACAPPPSDALAPYSVEIDAAHFVDAVNNPYFPLVEGTVYVYETDTAEGTERVVIEVLSEKKLIAGIPATVVHDTVNLDGQLIEDTFDWYAQDADGNVWYLGEDVSNYEGGQFSDKAGSWETGVDGALPGIVMFADPGSHIGETYRQEYYAGHAEDMADLLTITANVSLPIGSFTDVLMTRDYTPLEPGLVEEKYYVPGIGSVKVVNAATGEQEVLVQYSSP